MKKILLVLFTISFLKSYAVLIAGWDFQTTTSGGTAMSAAPSAPTTINANFGIGAIYLNGTNGSSTWTTATSGNELTSNSGSSLNTSGTSFTTTTSGQACMTLLNSSANGKGLVFLVDMTNHTDLIISYATQRTTSGFNTQTWYYSTNGTTWTSFSTQSSIPTSYGVLTLPTITALNGVTTAYIKLEVTGATTASGNNRLDNIQFNASLNSTCGLPTTVSTNSVFSSSANITWSAPSTGTTPSTYNYEVRTSGAAGSGATGLVSSGFTAFLSASIAGLSGSTTYNAYVQGNCGGSTSNWTSAISFTTSAAAPIATLSDNGSQVIASNISKGVSNSIISSFKIQVANSDDTLSSVAVNTGGNYQSSDLFSSGFKLWFNSTANVFALATNIGAISSSSTGTGETLNFTSLSSIIPVNSTGYFWITADVSSTATTGRTLYVNSIASTDLVFLSGSQTGSVTAGGTQTIQNPPAMVDIIVPQYIQGSSGTNNNRLPFVFRAKVMNLNPNSVYRSYSSMELTTASATSNGAGNNIFQGANIASNFTYSSSTGMGTAGNYNEFSTNSSGEYTGWFMIVPTGNATRFAPGTNLNPRILLNNGNGGGNVFSVLTSLSVVTVIDSGIGSTNRGSALYGISNGIPKNFVFLYDNASGTGRPLVGSYLESEGLTIASMPGFYTSNVDGQASRFGVIIPNSNSNGIRRIEQRDFYTGDLVGCPAIDADGVWPSGANTVSPSVGFSSPIVLTNTDVPLNKTNGISTTSTTITGLTSQCTDSAGWSYYGTGSDLYFAILKGSSGMSGESVDIEVQSTIPTSTNTPATNKESGSFLMKTSWNVNASTQPSIPVKVRFFYNQSDSADVMTARNTALDAILNATTGTNPSSFAKPTPFEWFKTVGVPYNSTWIGSIVGNTFPSNHKKLTPSFGYQNGMIYAEFTVDSFSGGTGGAGFGPSMGAGTALPVTWAGFDIHVSDLGNELVWKTASEKNTSHFEVEYSYDGIHFISLDSKIMAAGNSAELKTYRFVHSDFSKLIYYRIRQTDNDHKFSYSEIKLAKRTTGNPELSIFPLPISNDNVMKIKFENIDLSEIKVKLSNISGKIEYTNYINPKTNTHIENIDMSPFAPGIYFLELINGQFKSIKTIVKQ